jgi:rSAM/selenodomain-associated transferase 1
VNSTLLLYFVKYPEAGRVKTRLGRRIGMDRAAEMYRRLAEGNFSLLKDGCDLMDCAVVFDPPDKAKEIQEWLKASCCYYWPQDGAALGERITNAFRRAFESRYQNAIVLGSDTLGLRKEDIEAAADALKHRDAVLGPAKDGGYYLIGLSREQPQLFADIPWSTDQVLAKTLSAARRAGLSVAAVAEREDLDDVPNLEILKRGGMFL